MPVVTACPLRVASIVWQPRPGAFALTVVCKATYTLAPGTAPLASTQEEPNERDVYWHDDRPSSIHHASDLAPFKRRADVLLVGHAYAPGGQEVASLAARLAVGDVDKAIAVHGDRCFTFNGRLSEPVRFGRMPLRWERAAGGPDTPNPVGLRLDAPFDARGVTPVPNLQRPDAHVESRGDAVEPVGFGPIAPAWPGRLHRLHRHAASWDHRSWNERPLPGDIDAGYFNAAPPDQQVAEIQPDARIILENLHPEHPRLVTSLQPVFPRAVHDPPSGSPQEVRLRCDTLSLDTDRATVSLTWRGIVQLDHPAQHVQIVVTALHPVPRAVRPIASLRSSPRSPPGALAQTAELGALSAVLEEVLPFRLGNSPLAHATPQPPAPKLSLGSTASLDPGMLAPRAVLPFSPAHDAGSPPPPAAPPHPMQELEEPTQTLTQPVAAAKPLPFSPGQSPLAHATSQPPVRRPHSTMTLMAIDTPARAILPFAAQRVDDGGSAPRTASLPLSAAEGSRAEPPLAPPPPLFTLDLVAPGPVSPAAPPPVDEVPAPAPPPMIGPLATPEMLAAPPPPAEAPSEPPEPPEPAAPVEPALPLAAFPIERCAAIAASIGRRRADKPAILQRNDLDPELWTKLDRHWADAIRQEMERGRAGLLHVYDAAYVGQLETERGPITVAEYARLVTASDLGTEAEVLAALDLPKGAVLRAQRLWLDKLAEDAALGARVREAIETARGD